MWYRTKPVKYQVNDRFDVCCLLPDAQTKRQKNKRKRKRDRVWLPSRTTRFKNNPWYFLLAHQELMVRHALNK